MQIFVTGGTGLIGKRLLPKLVEEGHRVTLLTRDPSRHPAQSNVEPVQGDPAQAGPWLDRVLECDAVVHLAGEPAFAHRWSCRVKRRILDSRVLGTRLVSQQLAKSPRTASGERRVLLSASGIGYYGARLDDEENDETSPPGDDFLARVCVDWEAAAAPAREAGCRVAHLRIGVVLDPTGGALQSMARPFKWFVGGVIASGKQWVSWIHADDMVRLILFSIQDARVEGPINGVAPEPVKSWGFAKTLGKVLSRPCWFPTPGFVIRLVVGQAAQAVTRGQRVRPRKAESLGFQFHHVDLEEALRDLYGRPA